MKKTALLLSLLLSLTTVANASAASTTISSSSSIISYTPTSLIKKDGSFWVWGYNQSVPTQISGLTDADILFENGYVQKKDGSVWLWQRKGYPQKMEVLPVQGLKHIAGMYSYGRIISAVDEQGLAYIGAPAAESDSVDFSPVPGIDNVAAIESYYSYKEMQYIFLKKDGTVWKDNNKLTSFEPIQGLNDVVQLSYNLALKQDGTVWTWPVSETGKKETKPVAIQPTQLKPLTGIQKISRTGYAVTGVDGQGRLWFWGATLTGYSDSTQLNEQLAPVLLTGIKNVKDAFVAERTLVALTTDGKVYTTSLDLNVIPANAVFTPILSDVISASNGYRHIIFQKSDGTLWGWGVNKDAQLGYGDYEFMHNEPVPVQKPISISLNGENIPLTSGVITQKGQNFIPLRSVFEKLGAQVTFDNTSKLASVALTAPGAPAVTISVSAATGETKVNNELVTLANRPFTVNGTLYLPLRFISEKLGASVDWLPQEERIAITMK